MGCPHFGGKRRVDIVLGMAEKKLGITERARRGWAGRRAGRRRSRDNVGPSGIIGELSILVARLGRLVAPQVLLQSLWMDLESTNKELGLFILNNTSAQNMEHDYDFGFFEILPDIPVPEPRRGRGGAAAGGRGRRAGGRRE